MEFEGAPVTGKEIEAQRGQVTCKGSHKLVKAMVPGKDQQPPETWGLGTHLSDEGQLQGDIEDDLGVARCQLLSSVYGKGAPSQSPRVEQPVSDTGLQHATCAPSTPGGLLGRVPSRKVMAWAESHR